VNGLLVSVVVPAWNAADTLGETLRSVAAQTFPDLEILIVDDGSTDATARVAEEFCAQDSRARLIRQDNAGVAAARNAGIAVARARFVAPIDADDLWHAEKVERQLACFEHSPPQTGLVYNWSRIIDERGRILAASTGATFEGFVLPKHLAWNFIGNGSTPMIRTEIARDLPYNPALREAGCQGCEDYLLQLQIASRFQFACVPAFLTHYRLRSGVMSSDLARMIRSHILMYRMLLDWLPREYRPVVRRQLGRQFAALGIVELRRGNVSSAVASSARALTNSPAGAATETWARLARSRRVRKASEPAAYAVGP
jgi:glycosyltransferase involved in cell wall biosynthesis